MSIERSFQKFFSRLEQIGLRSEIEKRALKANVSLRDLYDGKRAPSIIAARRSVYLWLTKRGKGVNEIAYIFDRAPSGVSRMMSGRNG